METDSECTAAGFALPQGNPSVAVIFENWVWAAGILGGDSSLTPSSAGTECELGAEVARSNCGLRGLAAFLGDFAAFPAFRSAAFFSRAAYSSGGGTFSLMLSLRTPAAKLSISSPFTPAGLRGSLDADRNAFGTCGTDDAFLGLADRFGVADLLLRGPADEDRLLAAFPGRGLGCMVWVMDVRDGVWSPVIPLTSDMGALPGRPSGVPEFPWDCRSVAGSIVVLRLREKVGRFGVSCFGVFGTEDLGFLKRSFILFSSTEVPVSKAW